MAQNSEFYQCYIPKAKPSDLFPICYDFRLILSIEELKQALAPATDYMGFDTETTGLSAEKNFLVGYSFCLDGKTAYYVPVRHATFGLGDEALDLIYEKMCNTKTVAMFNMRFDVRMMEWHGYIDEYEKIQLEPLTQDERDKKLLQLSDRQFFKYDMAKVNVYDVQAVVYLADTNIKYPSLKASEEWYLGWRGHSFEETLGDATNFYHLTPEEAYQYAAVDALGTYLLGIKCKPFYDEAKTSGQLDVQCLQPLTRFENELTKIDVHKLKEYSETFSRKIEEVQNACYAQVGYQFNMGSPKDRSNALDELGIYTGERNKRGEMKTNAGLLEECIDNLDKNDPNRKFLENLIEYATLKKQQSSYVDNIIEMCNNEHHRNHLRFSYKTTEVPSGRLAAGGDRKNDFFANLNIQNITKPHAHMYFVQHQDLVKQKYPEMIEMLDKSGTREEGTYNGAWCFRILDWIFWDKPFEIDGQQEMQSEGFTQDLNIRSAFLPDDGRYWVSLDFNAEEIRVPALISKEPVWLNTFMHGGDVHKNTAIALWGEENYSRDKRKWAKGANFGILYGQTARNFADGFGISYEEAQEFVMRFKTSLPILFSWVSRHEREAKQRGTVYTMFGRPRRVAYWMNHPEQKMVAFGKRTAVNTTIQGTGADILKIAFLKLFKQFYTPKDYRQHMKFINTIHDEINYNVRKESINIIVPRLIQCMRLKLPQWEFPMEVGLGIGNRWGQCVDFEFDTTTFQILRPKMEEYHPKKKEEPVVESKPLTYEEKNDTSEDLTLEW